MQHNTYYIMGGPCDSLDEEWMAHLNWPPLMPIEIITMSQPHINLKVGMVGLVKDAFVVVEQIVEQATHDSHTTQPKMVGERVAQRNGVPL